MKRYSTYHKLGIPDSLATILAVLAAALFLSPYFPGETIGSVSVPVFSQNVSNFLKVIGPLILFFSLLGFMRTWPDWSSNEQFISLIRQAFDRTAFRVSFANEAVEEDFIHAVDDTIRALNTGTLIDRKTKVVLMRVRGGRSVLKDPLHRQHMEKVLVALENIRKIYKRASEEKMFRQFEHNGYYFRPEMDRVLANQIDDLTLSAIESVNEILADEGIDPLPSELDRDHNRGREH